MRKCKKTFMLEDYIDCEMWTIVLFIDENSIEVVPKSWLAESGKFCFWPTDYKIGQKISYCEPPDKDTWKLFRIRFPGGSMKLYDDILKARKACQAAEDHSSFSENSDREGRKRRKRVILSDTSSDEERERCVKKLSIAMPQYRKPSNRYTTSELFGDDNSQSIIADEATQLHAAAATDDNFSIHLANRNSTAAPTSRSTDVNNTLNNTLTNSENNTQTHRVNTTPIIQNDEESRLNVANKTNALLQSLFREVAKVNIKIDILQQDVQKIIQGRNKVDNNETFFKNLIPVKEDIGVLEEELANEEKYNQFVSFVSLIGGVHKGEAVSRSLSRILSNQVASQFSWKGKKAKRCFENLKICNAIIEGIMQNPQVMATKKDLEVEIMSWLRHAPERLKREK